MKMVRVLVKEVSKPAETRTVKDDYKEFQKITRGYFSGYSVGQFLASNLSPLLRNVMLLCNDTGKLDGLPENCYFGSEQLVGNVLFCAYDRHGETIDLTRDQVQLLKNGIWQ